MEQSIKLSTTKLGQPGFESQDPQSRRKEMISKYCPLTSTGFPWAHHVCTHKHTIVFFFNCKKNFENYVKELRLLPHTIASSVYVQHTLTRLD